MPLIEILADMQIQGIGIEKSKLVEYSNILNEKMVELAKEIYEAIAVFLRGRNNEGIF